jgi:hypothetical protein
MPVTCLPSSLPLSSPLSPPPSPRPPPSPPRLPPGYYARQLTQILEWERQIVSVIASGESHPSMLTMGSSASATMWILVRFYLVEDFTIQVLLSFLTTRNRSWPERTHYRRRRTPLR